jgi:hypothetical protein
MKTGLLWFDDDPRKELEEKVLRAAAHYERKYGRLPELCYVHPDAFNGNGNGNGKRAEKRGKKDDVVKAGEVEVRAGRSVLLHHFWLGMAEEKTRAASRKSR